jgi:hypothetical protein
MVQKAGEAKKLNFQRCFERLNNGFAELASVDSKKLKNSKQYSGFARCTQLADLNKSGSTTKRQSNSGAIFS